jgi:hypothetical protein
MTAAEAPALDHVQAKLDALARVGHFPWKTIEDEIARRELLLPIFNFVNFHNTAAGARRLAEGVVQSRFHTPLTFFVKLSMTTSTASAALRLGFDRARFGSSEVEAMRTHVHDSIVAAVRSDR